MYRIEITSIKLPYPFATNCLDYSALNYNSQDECIEKCILSKQSDSYSESMLVIAGSKKEIIPGYPSKVLLDQCTKMCSKPDCKSTEIEDITLKESKTPGILEFKKDSNKSLQIKFEQMLN